MGFIETPYRKVTNGVVDLVSTPIYLSAEEEEGMLISQIFRWTILEKSLKRNCNVKKVIPVIDPKC
jgi:DNA-directed RNA polymerase beta subunit